MLVKLARRLVIPSLSLIALCTLLASGTNLLAHPEPSTTSELAVEINNVISGTPLKLTITGVEEQTEVQVRIDGRLAGSGQVTGGQLVLKDTLLGAGKHQIEISTSGRGGSRRTASTERRLLPGWLSLLPPLLAIGLALATRDVLISLFLGIFGGALILNGWNPFAALGRTVDQFIVPALTDESNISIIVFTAFLGGMVGLITKSGGTRGIIERLAPYATTRRRGQLATWAMGVLIFFDDYANTLIVGPTMRPITDRLKISREKLAYIVDSTAAPVVCLFPISTWVGYELGLIQQAFRDLEIDLDAYTVFIRSIPYRFYPLFALLAVLTLAWRKVDFGPMRKAERRAAERGELLPPGAVPIADYSSQDTEPPEDAPLRASNAFLPILTVVLVTLWGLYATGAAGKTRALDVGMGDWLRTVLGDANSFQALLWASLSGMLIALLLPVAQRILSLGEAIKAMVAGFKAMLLALCVLTLAWSIGNVCGELHTADFLVALTHGVVSPMWLPALTFILSAAVAFATGSSWGTMAILEPLVIPICHELSVAAGLQVGDERYMAYMLGTIAAVLSGSVWGDHCSPISDTTILSSMATGCDHIAHVRTQIPYALSVGALALIVGCLGNGLGLPAWLALVIGAGLLVGGVIGGEKLQARRSVP